MPPYQHTHTQTHTPFSLLLLCPARAVYNHSVVTVGLCVSVDKLRLNREERGLYKMGLNTYCRLWTQVQHIVWRVNSPTLRNICSGWEMVAEISVSSSTHWRWCWRCCDVHSIYWIQFHQLARCISVWSFHVLHMSAWVFSLASTLASYRSPKTCS